MGRGKDTKLVCGADDGNGFEIVVPGAVFAAGADSDSILLERHPDRIAEIEARLWGDRNENGWRIADPRDTIYFDNRQKATPSTASEPTGTTASGVGRRPTRSAIPTGA